MTFKPVGEASFGEGIEVMKWLMDVCGKLRNLSRVEVRIVLRELYEQKYGIYNKALDKEPRPMSSVALHPAENITDDSVLEESMELFVRHKIYELFGLSHTELMRQTREVVGLYYKVANKEMEARSQVATNAENAIKRDIGKTTNYNDVASNARKPLR